MDANEKKLIQLRTKLKDYNYFKGKIQDVMFGKLKDMEELETELYYAVNSIETELSNHKFKMDLPDNEWDEDETKEDKFA